MKFVHIIALPLILAFFLQSALLGANPPKESFVDDKPFVVSPAHALNLPQIGQKVKYPIKALEKGVESNITFYVKVSAEGRYLDHRLSKTSNPDLVKAIIKHLPNLKFKPAQLGEDFVTQWVPVTFSFQIQ